MFCLFVLKKITILCFVCFLASEYILFFPSKPTLLILNYENINYYIQTIIISTVNK